MPKQSCNWCFTINNPSKVKTCGEKDKFKDLTFTELAIKYAKREQLRIIIDKALNIHADCEYEALSKLINELKQMLEEA